MEHTPGPWHFNGNEIVANENPRMGIGGFVTSEADNYLAAAAPELLEAVEELLEAFVMDNHGMREWQKEVVIKANRVISKAKNEK